MLANLKTGTKLLIALSLAAVVLLLVGGLAWITAGAIAGRLEDATEQKIPTLMALTTVDEAEKSIDAALWKLVNRRVSPAQVRQALETVKEKLVAADDAIKAYEAKGHEAEDLALWKAWKDPFTAWRRSVDRIVGAAGEKARLLEAGTGHDAPAMITLDGELWSGLQEAQAVTAKVEDAIDAVQEKNLKDAASNGQAGKEASSRGLTTIAVAVLLATVLLAAMALVLARKVSGMVAALVGEAGKLRQAVAAGRLDVRGDETAVEAEFRPIIVGVNETMEAFQAPIRVTADCLSKMGKGDVPPRITDAYQGDFNLIKSSLNECIDAVNALVADAGMLAKAGVEGRLATRADASRHQGDFRKVVQGVNDTLDAVITPLEVAARYVDQISRGQIPAPIAAEYAGDFNTIKENLNRCIEAVNRLVADAGMLAQAGVEGRLATRADATRHEGDFRKVVDGVNRTLDAVIGPLTVTARYVDEISKGRIPRKITDAYRGDFDALKGNLNTCVDAVNLLVADAGRLVEAAVAGRLDTRADASRHQGDFRKIVEGVNQTLDAVLAPVHEAAGVLEKLARRDLQARVTGSYQGDHAKIKESLNATGEALHDALAQVASAVEQVSSAATQIASSSQAVAAGASEQASSLEETSSSLESVLSITRQATDNAQQANTLAQTARTAATEGAASVEQMQGAMVRIKASAESTSQIIKDINDIAFQTNLLALNAAVEAARAGEAGRGFAVVAEEVRSLALRAKEAATKTEELIRQSVREAGHGEVTSRQVAGKLGEILSGVGKVSDIVSEIAAAAREQTAGIDQVNKAVAEMDKVTQQNAASAEESSSAASELNGQAEELAAMVGGFRLGRLGPGGQGARRPAIQAGGAPPRAVSAARKNGAAAPALPVGAMEDRFPMDQHDELRDF